MFLAFLSGCCCTDDTELVYTSTSHFTVHPHSPLSLITITEIDTIHFMLLLHLATALVLGNIDRSSVFFKRFIVGPVSTAFKYLFAWKSFSYVGGLWEMIIPVSRPWNLLYSSRSLGVRFFNFSSCPFALLAAISLSNLTFQAKKDSRVTGVPRVFASSA